jgi:antitoxin HicB
LSKDEGGGFAISFPDLPGCWSDGATPEKAIVYGPGKLALDRWLARRYGA